MDMEITDLELFLFELIIDALEVGESDKMD